MEPNCETPKAICLLSLNCHVSHTFTKNHFSCLLVPFIVIQPCQTRARSNVRVCLNLSLSHFAHSFLSFESWRTSLRRMVPGKNLPVIVSLSVLSRHLTRRKRKLKLKENGMLDSCHKPSPHTQNYASSSHCTSHIDARLHH